MRKRQPIIALQCRISVSKATLITPSLVCFIELTEKRYYSFLPPKFTRLLDTVHISNLDVFRSNQIWPEKSKQI